MEIVDHSVSKEFNNDNKTQAIFQLTFKTISVSY